MPLPTGRCRATSARKIALFCNVRPEAVIQALDVASIYDVPLPIMPKGLDREVLAAFGIADAPEPDLERWRQISETVANPEGEVTIAIVGKYTGLKDAYKSLNEALVHGGIANKVKVNLDWIESRDLRERGRGRRISRTCTASWCPAASASAAPRARSGAAGFARDAQACPISASASACRWR